MDVTKAPRDAFQVIRTLTFSKPSPAHSPGPLLHIWDSAPKWVVAVVVIMVALGTLFTQVTPLAKMAISIGRFAVGKFRRRDREEVYRIIARQGFARHVESQLKNLAVKEDWRDDRFAELEAEVEVEGRERVVRWLRHSPSRVVNLRREKSLSKGLERTTDSLVILEGEPGSGKSVALRHLAERLAREAERSHSSTSLIPLYVNLKEFRPLQRPVNSKAVRDFIFESLTRANDRDVEVFIEDEFDRGMREGSWLLLLDSFDEIPDVLSSTESDKAVEEYALAINDFLSGMRVGRAIVASREFRGPRTFQVPRFRIVALTPDQQRDLISRSGLKPPQQDIVHEGLAVADPELQQMSKNPMFLGLVCEYVRTRDRFPPNSHAAYDSYLEQRLQRDADRIRQKYGVGPDTVRAIAEETAFCMADSEGLALSPSRAELRSVLATDGRVSVGLLDKVLDALEYTKLGRAADDPSGSGQLHFTFAHRRFQEYFATRVVLRSPDRVSVHDLVTSGRWRETAVTILQTEMPSASQPLLDEAWRLLAPMVEKVCASADKPTPDAFQWPVGCLHLLQMLDAGLGRSPDSIPGHMRVEIGRLLRAVWKLGRRHDKKWAASVALIADRETTIWLIEQAFASRSVYLGGAAYTCVSRLSEPPTALYSGVRQTLLDITANRQLKAERIALKAQISRLPDPDALLRVLRMLAMAGTVDILLGGVIAICDAIEAPLALVPSVILFLLAFHWFPRRLSQWDSSAVIGGRQLIMLTKFNIATVPRLCVFLVQEFALVALPPSSLAYPLILLLSLYFIVWPPIVEHACRTGRGTHVLAWPVEPLVFAIYGVRRLRLPRVKLMTIVKSIGLVILMGGISALVFYFWKNSGVQLALNVIALVIGVLLVCGIIAWTVDSVFSRHRDANVIRRLEGIKGPIDSGVILCALDEIRTSRGARAIVGIACGIDLIKSPGVLRFLCDLSIVMEDPKRFDGFPKGFDESGNPEISVEFSEWLNERRPRAWRALRETGSPTLDKISRALERAELSRQADPAASY